jgi:hypothetical protein
VWRAVALTGVALLVFGLGAVGLDFATMDHVGWSEYFGLFLLAILVGAICLLAGLIGWAAMSGKRERGRLATMTLIIPAGVFCIAYFAVGTNVHGPFYLFAIPSFVLILVA